MIWTDGTYCYCDGAMAQFRQDHVTRTRLAAEAHQSGAWSAAENAQDRLAKAESFHASLRRVNPNTHQAPSGLAASQARQMVAEAQRAQRAGQHDVAERALKLARDYLADNPDVGMQADRAEIDRTLAIYTGRAGPIKPPGK